MSNRTVIASGQNLYYNVEMFVLSFVVSSEVFMILSCSHISKSFGTDVILNDVSFHIEDYENGYLIVSKSDGILYGAIDRNNKNIIPMEYDSASFFDSELLKKKGKVFIKTSYEKKKSVFNKDGNKIIIRITCKIETGMLE